MVANDQASETQRRAGKLRADLQYGRIDEILATGLHAFLTQFLDRVNELGVQHQPRLSGAGHGVMPAVRQRAVAMLRATSRPSSITAIA